MPIDGQNTIQVNRIPHGQLTFRHINLRLTQPPSLRIPLSRERTPEAADVAQLHRELAAAVALQAAGEVPEVVHLILSRTATGSSARWGGGGEGKVGKGRGGTDSCATTNCVDSITPSFVNRSPLPLLLVCAQVCGLRLCQLLRASNAHVPLPRGRSPHVLPAALVRGCPLPPALRGRLPFIHQGLGQAGGRVPGDHVALQVRTWKGAGCNSSLPHTHPRLFIQSTLLFTLLRLRLLPGGFDSKCTVDSAISSCNQIGNLLSDIHKCRLQTGKIGAAAGGGASVPVGPVSKGGTSVGPMSWGLRLGLR